MTLVSVGVVVLDQLLINRDWSQSFNEDFSLDFRPNSTFPNRSSSCSMGGGAVSVSAGHYSNDITGYTRPSKLHSDYIFENISAA